MKRILVVDDETDIHNFVGRILRDSGYEVEVATDGKEALEKIAAWHPDLVLLDLMMPVMDGWAVLAHLRETPDPPLVVVLTARGDFEAFARGVRAGVAAFVSKPFHFGDLLSTCQRVLEMEGLEPAPAVERRRSERRRLMVGARVLSTDGMPQALGELVDISPHGARVRMVAPLEVGSHVRVGLHISLADSPLQFEGHVCWRNDDAAHYVHGLAFSEPTPELQAKLHQLFRPSD
jgi:CheY-like chemotaxis protein